MDFGTINIIGAVAAISAVVTALILVGKWIGKREGFEQNANQIFANIVKTLDEVRADIKKIFREMPRKVSAQESPLRLTDFGKSISDSLEAQQWAKGTAEQVKQEVDGFTAYAIQEWAYRFVKQEDRLPSTDMPQEKMEITAFNHGVGLQQVHEVLALELRDELLNLHGLEAPEDA